MALVLPTSTNWYGIRCCGPPFALLQDSSLWFLPSGIGCERDSQWLSLPSSSPSSGFITLLLLFLASQIFPFAAAFERRRITGQIFPPLKPQCTISVAAISTV